VFSHAHRDPPASSRGHLARRRRPGRRQQPAPASQGGPQPTSGLRGLPAAPPWTGREAILLGLLLLVAGIMRASVWAALGHQDVFRIPFLDSLNYHQWAQRLAAGDWGRGEPYWMGPLYPHLLAVTYAIFGSSGVAPRLIQLALTLLNVGLLHLLGRRLLGVRGGLLAAGLYAFYGPPVLFAGALLMVTVLTTLLLLCTIQAVRVLDRPTAGRHLGLGALVGVAGLARGNVLLLLLGLPLLTLRRLEPGGQRRRAVAALWLGGFLVLVPVAVRNVVVGGDLVLLTYNMGANLYIGQHTRYQGIFGPANPDEEVRYDPTGEMELEEELGRDVTPGEVSRIYLRRAVDEILAQPGAWLVHTGRKAYRLLNGYELPQLLSWDYWRHRTGVLRLFWVPFTLLSALGLLGLLRLRGPTRLILAVIALTYYVSLLPFFPTTRYRLPLVPLLTLAAVGAGLAVARDLRHGLGAGGDPASRRRGLRYLVLGLLLVLVLLPRWAALPADEVVWSAELNRAARLTRAGQREAAMAAVERAEESLPGLFETMMRLGHMHLKLGDLPEAEAAYREAAARAPQERITWYRLGQALHAQGKNEEALQAYGRAAELDPGWGWPHAGAAMVQRDLGNFDLAIAAMREAVACSPGAVNYQNDLASLLAESGRLDEAVQTLEQLVARFPTYVKGWLNLALARWKAGAPETACEALARGEALPRASAEERQNMQRLRLLFASAGDPAQEARSGRSPAP
jgi:tetratricopeptide (TPR) repeat protein